MKFSIDTIVRIMNDNVVNNIKCYTRETCADCGTGLMWRTIIVEDVSRESERYQALSFKDYDNIMNSTFTLEQIQELIDTANRIYGGC